ncbi:MFS transporter [Azorhizobium caulinodans]|uniref:MFS transporter n=1 Tax=Azorhizobium caulinodans TaxID=7 RepID=UPI002FBE7CAF
MTSLADAGAAAAPGQAAPAPLSLRLVLAGSIGNTLEWYDFGAYGFLAAIFARNFFPADSGFAALLAAYGMMAASFLMRPVGGVIFGHIGDRYGRRHALYLSAALMCVSTVAIGLLPTYATAGMAAPILLLALRLLQGVSIGGEYSSSVVFLAESAKPRWRGLLLSLCSMGAMGGTMLGSLVGAATASFLSQEELIAWGWRMPFFVGLLLGGTTLWLRHGLQSAPERSTEQPRSPLLQAFADDWRAIVICAVINLAGGVNTYTLFVYLVTYMEQVDGLSPGSALQVNTASMVVAVVLMPMFAALSDVIGRKRVLVASLLGFILFGWPLFRLVSGGTEEGAMLGQLGFAVLISAYTGVSPAVLAELFKRATRCSAAAVSNNVSRGIAGGTAPMVGVYLVSGLHDPMGPALYIICVALISLIATLCMTDRTRLPLP